MTTSAIDTLPNELLLTCFKWAIVGKWKFPVLASGICSKWREICISSPTLWTGIYLFHGYPLPLYKLFLDRSKPCLVDVTFCSATFIAEFLLRQGPPATGGSIAYREAEPLFANTEPDIIAEYGEIPSTDFHTGGLFTKATVKRGYGVRMSQEMLDRNDTATFARNTQQAINTMRLSFDRLCFQTFKNHPRVGSVVSSTATSAGGWLDATTGIRKDVAAAMYAIQSAHGENSVDERYNYNPDTLVLHPAVLSAWIDNEEINATFMNSPAVTESPRYRFVFPRTFFGLNIVTSFEMPVNNQGRPNAALLCQRSEVGFISDERPFRVTPLYEHKPTESWRSDMTRISTMGIDNPLAAVWITGIDGT